MTMTPAQSDFDTLVLGIGNILWADEGFGTRAVQVFNARYALPQNVCALDGGTQGMFLLPWIRQASRLLVFDAIDFGLPPATLRLVRDADVPRYMGAKKVSMHQTGFQEVLAMATLTGELPGSLALIGVQPHTLDDFGGSLTDRVKAQLDPAVRLAAKVLGNWGSEVRLRPAADGPAQCVAPPAIDIADYEAGRPRLQGDRQ